MRLIDSDAEVYGYVETWVCDCSEFGKQSVMAVEDISYLPEIDPETLPIVQELRKELERVTRERDAAIADLYYACACETCELLCTDKCPLKKGMVPCSHIASDLINDTPYKWRGIQEAQEDE